MQRLLAIALAALLASASGGALAQYDQEPVHRANRDRIIQIMTRPEVDEATRSNQVREFLSTLPKRDAFRAQYEVLDYARKQGAIGHLDYSKGMVDLYSREAPNLTVPLDYWRYYVMIAAKLERKEIPEEEFEYLRARKFDEANAIMRERKQQAAAAAENAARAKAAEAKAQAAAEERQQAENDERFRQSMIEFADRLKSRRGTNTQCTQYGGVLNCNTR